MTRSINEAHTPEAEPGLVERVAQMVADYCCADEVEEFERELARAVVALVLDEAAVEARKQQRPSYVKDFRDGYEVARADIISALRALIPGDKP